MRKTVLLLIFASCLFSFSQKPCTCKGFPLQGRVKVVKAQADLRVKIVSAQADLRVMVVKNQPNRCGEWQFVNAQPDITIQYVDAQPDITIRYVKAQPGPKK